MDKEEKIDVKGLKELKEQLSTLKELLDDGLITKDEYEEKRNIIMGKKRSEIIIEKVSEAVNVRPKVRKCPSCGEILNTFDTKCPTCGYEIREVINTSAMKKFQDDLMKLDEQLKDGGGIKLFGFDVLSGSGDKSAFARKCEYIKNYIVPRTKEDFIEFGILAKSNIETKLYHKTLLHPFCGCEDADDYNRRKLLSDAWWSMLQQIFDKTKIVFSDDEATYKKIEKLYVEIYNNIM